MNNPRGVEAAQPWSTAELFALSSATFIVSAIVGAWTMDAAGLRIDPLLVFLFAAAATALLWRRLRPLTVADDGATAVFVIMAAAVLALCLLLGAPSLLPPGSGPDLTHHLMLVD